MKLKTLMLSILLVLASISVTSSAFGQEVHKRIVHQHRRIHQGVKSGKLNHRQASKLRSVDAHVHTRAVKDRLHNQGRLTPAQTRRSTRTAAGSKRKSTTA